MKKKLLLLFLGSLQLLAFGQNYSLRQCIEYASTNNGNIKNAQYDVDISQKKINEKIGSMLPQMDASGSYTNNLKLSSTVLEQNGTATAIKMGTKHNLSAGVDLTQNIFEPSFGVALKTAKVTKEQSLQTLQQTKESIIYDVSTTYYQTLVIQKQTEVLKATLDASNESLASTELKYKNGMAKKVDIDKIRVSCNNTRSDLQQSELSYSQSLNNLKYYMGLPVDSAIMLADTALNINFDLLQSEGDSFKIEKRIDYQLQLTTLKLYELDKKNEISGYLPTFSFNAFYDYEAMRNEFNFLKSNQDWFGSYGYGFTLKVPIFDGLQRQSRISQSRINIEKTQESIHLTTQSIKVDISNYEIKYRNSIDNIRNEKENLDLAQSVYQNTKHAYQQGAESVLELVQAESSLREAQNNYFEVLLNYYIARIDLENAKGNLIEYIYNIK
jgi:outer membrane protein